MFGKVNYEQMQHRIVIAFIDLKITLSLFLVEAEMTPAATDEEEPAEETEEAQVSADVQQDQAVEALDSGNQ